MQICANCKYGVIGRYSALYKGRPIGCQRPDNTRQYNINDKNNCFEPKEAKND